jgi:hypothetical protein
MLEKRNSHAGATSMLLPGALRELDWAVQSINEGKFADASNRIKEVRKQLAHLLTSAEEACKEEVDSGGAV